MRYFLGEVALAFLIAVVLSFFFVAFVGWRRSYRPGDKELATGLLFFFTVLFLATWAGGLWLAPFGPTIWGVSWVGFLIVGLVVALLLAAVAPPRGGERPETTRGAEGPRRETEPLTLETGPGKAPQAGQDRGDAPADNLAAGMGVFFWALLALLVIGIATAYVV